MTAKSNSPIYRVLKPSQPLTENLPYSRRFGGRFRSNAVCGWSSSKLKNAPSGVFSTDLELPTTEILRLYRSRFWIEFLFRNAKQSAGLSDCQARHKLALKFHWNASVAAVNLARVAALPEKTANQPAAFSMKSLKQRFFNERLLKMFISKLALEQTLIKYQEHYENLRNYPVIST